MGTPTIPTEISQLANDVGYLTETSAVIRNAKDHAGNKNNPHAVTKAQVGLGNVGDFKAVSTVADQGLTDTEKLNARRNIGLGNVENKSSAAIRGELTSGNVTKALGYTPINPTAKGANNGVAELDANGKVPSSQLPSFVDDVIEGYLYNSKFYKESAHTTKIVSESGKIYIDLSTGKTYRWSGSTFVVISDTLALGETSSTAYRGDRGKVAYDHSQSAHAPSGAQANVIETVKVNGTALTPSSKAVNITINGSNLKTSATKTASNTSSISNSIASGTALDTAIQTLLNNDKVLDTKSGEVNNKSIPTYDANTYYSYGNVVYYEGKVYRHIKVSSGGVPGVKGQVPTNTKYWKEITVSDLFKELSDAASILSTLTSNDFDYSGGPTQIGVSPYTVNESLKAIANVLRSLNSNLKNRGVIISSEKYSGEISAYSFMPETMVLPAGTWLIATSGYIGYNNGYQPFGIGLNDGQKVNGICPSWVVKLDTQSKIYIWNILGETVTAYELVLWAISL